MVVTFGAAERQAEENNAVGIDPIRHVADIGFLFDRAALVSGHVAAQKAGGVAEPLPRL